MLLQRLLASPKTYVLVFAVILLMHTGGFVSAGQQFMVGSRCLHLLLSGTSLCILDKSKIHSIQNKYGQLINYAS